MIISISIYLCVFTANAASQSVHSRDVKGPVKLKPYNETPQVVTSITKTQSGGRNSIESTYHSTTTKYDLNVKINNDSVNHLPVEKTILPMFSKFLAA